MRPTALVLALVACGAEGPAGSGSEPTSHARQPIGAECATSSFDIYMNDEKLAMRLKPASTHLCWLTRLRGFLGATSGSIGGTDVATLDDGYWYLTNHQNQISEARCVPKSCFTGDGIDDVVWVSNHDISAKANCRSSPASKTTHTAWWGDAATILSSFPGPGKTNGSGENVQIIQSFDAFKSSGIQAADGYPDDYGSSGFIFGEGVSLFVGTPNSGKLARFTGSQFSVSGNTTLNLGVYSDEAICYFTKVYGKWETWDDSVRLYQIAQSGRNVWVARSSATNGDSGIKASGQCFYFNQWDK